MLQKGLEKLSKINLDIFVLRDWTITSQVLLLCPKMGEAQEFNG